MGCRQIAPSAGNTRPEREQWGLFELSGEILFFCAGIHVGQRLLHPYCLERTFSEIVGLFSVQREDSVRQCLLRSDERDD